MPLPSHSSLRLLAAGAFLALAATGARAEPLAYAGPGYGFGGNAVGGTYIGAPFTRVPSPDRLVPPAWGYGTYGVPTVAGIREAPAARPALYVIERQGRAENRLLPRRGAKVVTRGTDGRWTDTGLGSAERAAVEGSGAQVVSVRVPAK